jgi:inosine-uridine nucleoside N-ribohydrolase
MRVGRLIKVIIDTDPGVDDAIALLMALACPKVEVVGLTTVGGNVPLARGTRNTLALLEHAGRPDVPVARGAARPCRGRYPYAYSFHGPSGLSRRLPDPRDRTAETSAVDFLAARLQGRPGQITLVALGPLTNLAHLLRRHPGALDQAVSLVVMGGAVNVAGNVTPHAEFNFYSDPEADHQVLSSGVALTLVDLGAAHQVTVTDDEAGRWKARSHLGQLAVQLLNNWFRRGPQRERFEFYDPLAVAIDPGLAICQRSTLAVEVTGPAHLGESRVIAANGPVAVARQVERPRFLALLEELFDLSHRAGRD